MANQQTFYQMGLLDFDDDIKPFKIDKPIRLIELFAKSLTIRKCCSIIKL